MGALLLSPALVVMVVVVMMPYSSAYDADAAIVAG